MKKIVSVILIIACACMLFACGANAKDFQKLFDTTSPAKVIVSIKTVTAGLGELNASYAVTYNEDGSATVKYTYEKWNSIPTDGSALPTEAKSSYSGTVTKNADGSYSDADFAGGAEVAALSLNLEAISSDYSVSTDGSTLTATVIKGNTEAVFGAAFNYDVKLTVVKGVSAIEAISLEYVDGSNTVYIDCTYE